MAILTLILDILIIGLLVPTIAYAVILNKKLTALRKNRDDLARVVASFNEATLRAESGIPRLRQAANDAGASLKGEVEKAQALRDDLAYMIERGESMADRLEDSVRSVRNEAKPGLKEDAPRGAALPAKRKAAAPPLRATKEDLPVKSGDKDDERSEAERELLRALQSAR